MEWLTSLFKAVVSPVANTVTQINTNKAEVKKKQLDRVMKADDKLAEWEAIQAENSKGSWKDEFWTLVLSIPLIFAFYPDAVPVIKAGFNVIAEMPTFYQYWLGIAVTSSFGIKILKK